MTVEAWSRWEIEFRRYGVGLRQLLGRHTLWLFSEPIMAGGGLAGRPRAVFNPFMILVIRADYRITAPNRRWCKIPIGVYSDSMVIALESVDPCR